MADLLVIAAPLLMLVLLYCGWRAGRLLVHWKPATATVSRGDYGKLDQLEDFWIKPDYMTTRGGSMFERDEHREVDELVSFTDADGNSHRAPIRRQVQQGWDPDSIYTIWYDPDNPERATFYGPGSWLIGALMAGGALAWIFMAGEKFAGFG